MGHRLAAVLLLLMNAVFVPPAVSQLVPFTQNQVQGMVRHGIADATSAQAIRQQGIDFSVTKEFIESLKTSGADDAFTAALGAAPHRRRTPKMAPKPLSEAEVVALLTWPVPANRVAVLVRTRGIDFEPGSEGLPYIDPAGPLAKVLHLEGNKELLEALKAAKVAKPPRATPEAEARRADIQRKAVRASEFMVSHIRGGAADQFRDIVPLDPQDPGLHLAYSQALAWAVDDKGSQSEYLEALRLDPQNPEIYAAHGQDLMGSGDWKGSIREEQEALRLDPDDYFACLYLGAMLEQIGDHKGALRESREYARLRPNDVWAHAELARRIAATDDWKGSIPEYREALRLEPKNYFGHMDLGDALAQVGDRAGAMAEYREAIRLDSKIAAAHSKLGFLLGDSGDWDGQIAEEREAIRLNPHDDGAHVGLGYALCIKGDFAGAEAEEREALRLNPGNAVARNHLGEALEKSGDPDGAMALFREALKINPTTMPHTPAWGLSLARNAPGRRQCAKTGKHSV